ncbi:MULTISPECIES: hypothetical protein [Providencia]|nr:MULTISPECIES: hypothetical protein [Providencia]
MKFLTFSFSTPIREVVQSVAQVYELCGRVQTPTPRTEYKAELD